MCNTKKYISDIIGDAYRQWHEANIIIKSGTGTGKTYFVFNILAPYATTLNKKILYLCNRKPLLEQQRKVADGLPNVDCMTYQKLQANVNRKKTIQHYDYVIADEAHYLQADATFNEYTDVSWNYLKNQKGNVVIYMSASAGTLFQELQDSSFVLSEHIYSIKQRYTHIDKVFMYDKADLTKIIDYILEYYPDEKILVFVGSINRLDEMYSVYGDEADYLCSRNRKVPYVNYDCICNKQFSKRILFTTKALDNGIDIIDTDLCHIITEMFDLESTLQAIGRKRPVDMLDECRLYFRRYDGRTIAQYIKKIEKELYPVQEYLKDKDKFLELMANDNMDLRKLARENHILYADFQDEALKINYMALKKCQYDLKTLKDMQRTSYENVLFAYLGKELHEKLAELEIDIESKDRFAEYLGKIEGMKLFKKEQNQLKNVFREILGTKCRTLGIKTLNGQLEDLGYKYSIESKIEKSRQSKNRDKRFWIVTHL